MYEQVMYHVQNEI